MSKALDILIIGGGIAGCSAAIALSARGHRVEIVEKQSEWRFQSSGIFVYSNGLQSLKSLGLLEAVLEAGFAVPEGRNRYFDHVGQPIVDTFYPDADDGKIPAILGIKRAELHRVMADRVAGAKANLRLGVEVHSLANSHAGASVVFSDGGEGRFDLVIGADGIRSATRDMIAMPVSPRYTGFGVWRSVHRRPADLVDKIMMMGPAKRFGIMPISEDRLYTFGTVAEPKDTHYPPERWNDVMQARFAAFADPGRQFLQELGPASETLYTAVEEINLPLPWHRGCVVLIGDAAHASTPFMGQGGAMAMQDAVILEQSLDRHEDIETALSAFGEARFPVCQFVQDVSRKVGENGAKETQESQDTRNAELQATAQLAVDRFYARLGELNRDGENSLCDR